MKALNKFRRALAGGDVEAETARVAVPEYPPSIVRVKESQQRKHKVINYGYQVVGGDGKAPKEYKFHYLPDPNDPESLHPGVVPADFSGGVPVDDNMIYFYTREGMYGPEYRVYFSRPDPEGSAIPLYEMAMPEGMNPEDQWTTDVDELWVNSLQKLEDDQALGDESLDFLDADPLWLFGIADAATQRTLERSAVHPMLRCQGQRPCIEEWFAYLNADELADVDFKWVVESFAEVELPQPWTSFKGVGNVVCYLNNETNATEWKHPFYDYFRQLLDHCRRSTYDEHIKLRINRVLWSYEAEAQTDVQHQMPLVSPKYVNSLGEILGVNLMKEPFMVRTIKTFLRAFSQMYHEGELDTQEVKWCLEIVDNERTKDGVAMMMDNEADPNDALDGPTPGQLYCIECSLVATCYCPECEDCLCESCYEKLHMKGNRTLHEPNHFILCAKCKVMPAKLQCTYTRGKYCVDCYTNSHAKTLPKFLDLKPLKIDYRRSAKDTDPASMAAAAAAASPLIPEDKETFSKSAPLETTLGIKWHAFYDLRGVKYYYNFETQESLRRPQDELMQIKGEEDVAAEIKKAEIIAFLAKSKDPRQLHEWKEGHEPNYKPDV